MQISSAERKKKGKIAKPHNVEVSRVIEQKVRLFIEANCNGCVCAATSISETFAFSLSCSPFFSAEMTMKLPPPNTKGKAFYHAHLTKRLPTNTFPVHGAGLFRTRGVGGRSKSERLETDSVWRESLSS